MADDNNKYDPYSSYRRQTDKIIDVTKPRSQSSTPYTPQRINPLESNGGEDSSDNGRVSAQALREQQALERLKKRVNENDKRDNRNKTIKTIIAIILIILLIALAAVFIILIGQNQPAPEEAYDIRLSVQIEGKGSLSYITDTGKEKLNDIFPGDKLDISAYARNANSPLGDGNASGEYISENTFVRFKIKFILDYEERNNVIIPEYNEDMWYRYDTEEENNISNGVKEDDGFYYYMGTLKPSQMVDLFTSVTVNGEEIFCEDGGKYGQIQVIVESIEANIDNLTASGLWATAPRAWVYRMSGLIE